MVPVASILMGPAEIWSAPAVTGPPATASPFTAPAGTGLPAAGPAVRPTGALAELLAGNARFAAGEPKYGHHVAGAVATAHEQHPFAAVLGCVDSRVPVEAVFDQRFGAVFVARSAGHVLDRAVLGSVEFAVVEFAVPLVMVLGHTGCGAVRATVSALDGAAKPKGNLGYLVDQIAPAVRAAGEEHTDVTREHVRRTVTALRRLAPVRQRVDKEALSVVGALYHLESGRVEVL